MLRSRVGMQEIQSHKYKKKIQNKQGIRHEFFALQNGKSLNTRKACLDGIWLSWQLKSLDGILPQYSQQSQTISAKQFAEAISVLMTYGYTLMVQWIHWNAEDLLWKASIPPYPAMRVFGKTIFLHSLILLNAPLKEGRNHCGLSLRYQYWNFKIVVLQNPRLCWKQDPQRKIWLQQWLIIELMELPLFVSKFISSFLAWDVIPQN